MATPQCVKVDAVTVIRTNHGQAGEPAFSCFGLLYNREAAPATEVQDARHRSIVALSRGSSVSKYVLKGRYYSRESLAYAVYCECAGHS